MIRWLRRLAQARRDQATARYPGCERGDLYCLDQCCGCVEGRCSVAFLRARMRILKEQGR